jgi:hypothetical protein
VTRGSSSSAVVLAAAFIAVLSPGPSASPPSTTTRPCDGAWHRQAVATTHVYNALYGIAATSSADAWAAGAYVEAFPGPQQPLMIHWDGSTWTEIPGPTLPSSFVNGVAVISAGDAWVAGTIFSQDGGIPAATLVEHWNGTAWKRVKSPNPGKEFGGSSFRAIAAASAHDVWAGGEQNGAGFHSTNLIEHWDGERWSVVPTPRVGTDSLIYGMSAVSASDAWAIGAYVDPRLGVAQTLALHWDGASWSVVPTPNSAGNANWLNAVSADGPSDTWAVGQHLNSGGPAGDLIEHWDGTAWSIVPGYQPGGDPPGLNGVAARSPTLVWAVGGQEGPPGSLATFAERWNGTKWKPAVTESPGDDSNGAHAVAIVSSRLAWMAGSYDNGDGPQYPLIERFCT